MSRTADQRQRVAAAIELAEQGFSQRAIAEHLRLSQTAVGALLRRGRVASTLVDVDSEERAIITDARRQLVIWRERRRRLLPNADDPVVLSELCMVESQIRAAMHALDALGARLPDESCAPNPTVERANETVQRRARAGTAHTTKGAPQ